MAKKLSTDIFSLFSSTFIGQIIHVIALPYLTTFFSKENIGAFFFFQSITTIGLIAITLQSEQAIVVESNTNSFSNYKKSIIILTILSITTFLFICAISPFLKYFSLKSSISSWINLISPVLFVMGFNNINEYLFTFEKKFKSISFFRISKPICIYLFAFLFHYLGKTLGNPLILGFLSGNIVISIMMSLIIRKNKLCYFTKADFSIKSFKLYYTKHKKILVFNTISTGTTSTYMFIPYLFISFIFGEKYSAYYGMSTRVIGMPFNLLGQSFGQVFFQKFSSIFSFKHSLYPVLKSLTTRLYSMGIIPFILIFIFTPQLFHIFLGNGWEATALLARILLPWLFLDMVLSPISNIATVLGVQLKIIQYSIAFLLFRIICLLICWKLNASFIITMIIFTSINMAFSIFFQILFVKLAKTHKY